MQKIQLTQGKVALVDDSDYPALIQHKWCATTSPKSRTFYAIRYVRIGGKQVCVGMHHEIMGTMGIDHKDGNGLNNQRFNLRDANNAQQTANRTKVLTASGKHPTSKYKGVSSHNNGTGWIAQTKFNGKKKYLGYFSLDRETDAAKAYDAAAVLYFGEFAKLNFPVDIEHSIPVHFQE